MTLLHGDCLELMKNIPDGSVDMILCDLPFGTTQNSWDKVVPFEPLWEQYNRITKPNAAILLFTQMPFTIDAAASNRKHFRYEWIVRKPRGSGFLNAKKMPMKAHESILVFYRNLPTYNPQYIYGEPYGKRKNSTHSKNYGKYKTTFSTINNGKRYPIDVIDFKYPLQTKEKGLHPTAKPVELLEYMIKTYTNKGETVLDNCMGSGSTGVACANTERDFVGIELDNDYFNTAKERILQAYNEHQISMFV